MNYSIYLSSTLNDLADEREAIRKALSDECVVKHSYLAGEKDLVSSCLEDVGRCDAYFLVVGLRYGFIPPDSASNPDQLSITELEFRKAQEVGIPCLVFIKDEDHIPFGFTDAKTRENPPERVERFRALVSDAAIGRAARFRSVEDLPLAVVKAFNAFKEERVRQQPALEAEPGAPELTALAPPCPIDDLPELQIIDRGPAVRFLQRALRRQMQRQLPPLRDDGRFGWVTELWLRLFQFRMQESHQATMRIDGICGNQSWGWLAAFQPADAVLPLPGQRADEAPPRILRGAQGAAVRHLQRTLVAVNFSVLPDLPDDGIFDMATELHLRAFQVQLRATVDQQLTANGICSQDTWRWLCGAIPPP